MSWEAASRTHQSIFHASFRVVSPTGRGIATRRSAPLGQRRRMLSSLDYFVFSGNVLCDFCRVSRAKTTRKLSSFLKQREVFVNGLV